MSRTLVWALAPLLVCLATLYAPMAAAQQVAVDERLPDYQPISGVSGSIKSVGSDTMNNLMALWAEGFQKFYPHVQIEVEGKGSSTGPPALIAGTSQFAPMSRPMKGAEVDAFEKRNGFKPLPLASSIDMVAVYVHKDNPLARRGLTLQEVDAIFSKTRRGGGPRDIRTWGQLEATGRWATRPLSLYGRNSASGTYGYFKDLALFGGDFKDQVKEQPGSSSVVQAVAGDAYAIGYSGIGYITADVRAVPLAVDAGSRKVEASPQDAYTGEYPLARFLYVYINHKPGTPLDPLRREFIRYIFSKQGQQDVVKDGYYPVPWEVAKDELAKMGVREEN